MKTKRSLFQIGLGFVAFSNLCLQLSTAFGQPVTQIAAGGVHSLFLKSDGSLWVMGRNDFGQLGDGTFNNTNRPEQIVASNVTAIAAGGSVSGLGTNGHSLFLESSGSLWAMGDNKYGQLGDGTYLTANRPEQVVASNVTAIAAGDTHSLFIKTDGSLWSMGRNQYGQLGDGTYNNANRPRLIVASNVTAIVAGYGHSLFIKSDGSLWGMGENDGGMLGDGTYNNTNRPEQIVASNVMAVAAGLHTLFLKTDGSMWAMGINMFGELGNGTNGTAQQFEINRPELIVASNVTAIAAGEFHSLFLKSDGSLWGMGDRRYGALGDGIPFSPPNGYGVNRPEQILANGVSEFAAGQFHSLLLKNDGSLWACGFNGWGQMGAGNIALTNRPLQILGPYDQVFGQLLDNSNMKLLFVGIANANYVLDRADNLSPPDWMPQATNPASSFGPLDFTNTLDPATNNFWRIRSVP